ncbi:phage minor capsid protein [Schinkia azotoformans]|uniref:phage minor capsid protein n=1 Tax=Schinkia azotoformans TaxID=1454 RepID=UPI002DBB92EB|nr:phage minor capsid protein [Schinkia azotoformans]MEC1786078.1 hypothetical protein [Schinkia azotoformans]MED4420114.1 hypothetical protein [Schinkia azotoformans]
MFDELDKKTYRMIDKYIDAYAHLLKLLANKVDNNLSERHIRLVIAEIEEIVKELDEDAFKYCSETLTQYYLIGAENVDSDVKEMELDTATKAIVLHQKAIERAFMDTYEDLAARTRFMSNEMKKVIRNVSSDIINRQLVSGETRKKVVKELRDELLNNGVHSFVDNANRKWNIARYSEMLLRTKTRILTNSGTMDRLQVYQDKYPDNDNFDTIIISDHNARDWCKFYEGTVWSISGKSDIYPHVERLPNGYNVLHPNCRHIFQSYIPALRGKGKIVNPSFLDRDVKSLNKEYYHLVKKTK